MAQQPNTQMTPAQMNKAMGTTHTPKKGMTNSTMHGQGIASSK